jgi:monoamine oxidase
MDCDVLVLGAGIAGLACAEKLQDAGVSFKILEARSRLGGHAWSEVLPDTAVVEYGAEFIHGAHRESLDLCASTRSPFIDVCDRRLFKNKNRLVELPHFWEDLDRIHRLMNKNLAQDRSMSEFMKAHHRQMTPTQRKIYASYIEGFEAADLNLAGEKGLADVEQADEPELNKQSQFRPQSGYSSVISKYVKKIGLQKSHVVYHCEVQRLLHDDNGVSVIAALGKSRRQKTYRARQAVITLPIGVLQESVVFDPEIPELNEGLSQLHMGHIQRITFQFKDRFWEKLSDRPVGFLHAGPDRYFPTWWTQMPLRSPYLVAWQGGPKALEMSTWSKERRKDTALTTLAFLIGRKKSFLQEQCLDFFTHNWSQDPFALGAYSYIGVQRGRSLSKLQKVFHRKIVLAGEGVAQASGRGTVWGALKSGHEAAEKILAVKLNRSASTRSVKSFSSLRNADLPSRL